jgi:hypothetical protein
MRGKDSFISLVFNCGLLFRPLSVLLVECARPTAIAVIIAVGTVISFPR